jgi:hypothetical protein
LSNLLDYYYYTIGVSFLVSSFIDVQEKGRILLFVKKNSQKMKAVGSIVCYFFIDYQAAPLPFLGVFF